MIMLSLQTLLLEKSSHDSDMESKIKKRGDGKDFSIPNGISGKVLVNPLEIIDPKFIGRTSGKIIATVAGSTGYDNRIIAFCRLRRRIIPYKRNFYISKLSLALSNVQ